MHGWKWLSKWSYQNLMACAMVKWPSSPEGTFGKKGWLKNTPPISLTIQVFFQKNLFYLTKWNWHKIPASSAHALIISSNFVHQASWHPFWLLQFNQWSCYQITFNTGSNHSAFILILLIFIYIYTGLFTIIIKIDFEHIRGYVCYSYNWYCIINVHIHEMTAQCYLCPNSIPRPQSGPKAPTKYDIFMYKNLYIFHCNVNVLKHLLFCKQISNLVHIVWRAMRNKWGTI